jgi:glycosyltransferase involved in cell wall biosynthesis
MKPEISIVIITYNSSGVVLDCLKSVYDDAFEVIVVDNNSRLLTSIF